MLFKMRTPIRIRQFLIANCFNINIELISVIRRFKVSNSIQNNQIDTNAVRLNKKDLNKSNPQKTMRTEDLQADTFESRKKRNKKRKTNSAKNLLISIGIVLAVAGAGALAIKGKLTKPTQMV